ncbi:unnamed protein product [Closterium sp. Yama58-4]|nr:unnamed protein product [Closterium sp. Yama58-4]
MLGTDRVGMDRLGTDRLGTNRLGMDRLGRGRFGQETLHGESGKQRLEHNPSTHCGPSSSCVSAAIGAQSCAVPMVAARPHIIPMGTCPRGTPMGTHPRGRGSTTRAPVGTAAADARVGHGDSDGTRGDTNEAGRNERDRKECDTGGASGGAEEDVTADQVPLPNHPGWLTTKRRKSRKEELLELELAMEREYEAGKRQQNGGRVDAPKKLKRGEGAWEWGDGGERANGERGRRRSGEAGLEEDSIDQMVPED